MKFENVPQGWRSAEKTYKKLRTEGYKYLKFVGGTSKDGTHASMAITFSVVKKSPKDIVWDFVIRLFRSEKRPKTKLLILVTPFKPDQFEPKKTNQYSTSSGSNSFLTLNTKFFTNAGLRVVEADVFRKIPDHKTNHTKYFYLVLKTQVLKNPKLVIDPDKHYPLWLPVEFMLKYGHKSHKEIFKQVLEFIGQNDSIKKMLDYQLPKKNK